MPMMKKELAINEIEDLLNKFTKDFPESSDYMEVLEEMIERATNAYNGFEEGLETKDNL